MVGPLVLIFIGCVFLLQNVGYLPPNFWVNLWRLWPLILVLVGIELLLATRIPWLALAGLVVVVLVLGGLAANPTASQPPSSATTVTRTVPTDLAGATQAAVTVRFGAGQLTVGPLLGAAPGQLAVMTYDGPQDLAPQPRYTPRAGGVGQLEYQIGGRGPNVVPFGRDGSGAMQMSVNLAPNVPITTLTVQSGAADARLDLSTLRLSNLDISVGASSTWVRLPRTDGITTAHISGGAATIMLEVPQGVSAQIRHSGGLNTLNIDSSRFPQVGEGLYRSPDYDSATSKVDVTLETGIATIQVS